MKHGTAHKLILAHLPDVLANIVVEFAPDLARDSILECLNNLVEYARQNHASQLTEETYGYLQQLLARGTESKEFTYKHLDLINPQDTKLPFLLVYLLSRLEMIEGYLQSLIEQKCCIRATAIRTGYLPNSFREYTEKIDVNLLEVLACFDKPDLFNLALNIFKDEITSKDIIKIFKTLLSIQNEQAAKRLIVFASFCHKIKSNHVFDQCVKAINLKEIKNYNNPFSHPIPKKYCKEFLSPDTPKVDIQEMFTFLKELANSYPSREEKQGSTTALSGSALAAAKHAFGRCRYYNTRPTERSCFAAKLILFGAGSFFIASMVCLAAGKNSASDFALYCGIPFVAAVALVTLHEARRTRCFGRSNQYQLLNGPHMTDYLATSSGPTAGGANLTLAAGSDSV